MVRKCKAFSFLLCIFNFNFPSGDIRVYNGQKQIEAGKEILLSYGQFSNDKLLFGE